MASPRSPAAYGTVFLMRKEGELTHSRLHVSMAGFAIFLVINASQAWGGVFPFLPMSFQTDSVTLIFYLTQALSFFATFAISTVGAYRHPGAAQHMMVGIVTTLVFMGSACIIAAMYVPPFVTLEFIILGGLLLGTGCAGMFMLWQRYFASIPPTEGNLRLVVGTALASLLYFALYLIPTALTAFLVPVVLLPLSSLSLTLSVREMSFDQPMFEDIPTEHPQVYRRVVHDTWRGAMGVAAIAFTSGLARGVALLDAGVNAAINISAMLGAFIAAIVLLIMWRAFTMRFGLDSVFRVAFPILVTGLLLFPFMRGPLSLNLFAGIAYMAFSLVVVVMMMQSAQMSRDRGVNPVFSYGLLGSVAYGIQSAGFLLGWLLYDGMIPGMGSVEFLSLLALYVLGMALFLSNRLFRVRETADGASQIELIRLPLLAATPIEVEGHYMLKPIETTTRKESGATSHNGTHDGENIAQDVPMNGGISATSTGCSAFASSAGSARRPESLNCGIATHAPPDDLSKATRAAIEQEKKEDHLEFTDRLSKQCLILRQQYGLTKRETEVMEAIARGLSMANIAEDLFISENTVRTHAKHIYTKLDIHSRQELGAILQNVSP